jgi:DNA primase
MRKVLRPLAEKQYKWISNIPRGIFSGWHQLDKQNNQMIVTSSLKDCMVFRLLGFNSLAPQSESSFLNENQFQMLSMRFKNIIINYDNDETGLKFMRKYSQQFGIKSFVIPDGVKDISDYISIKGYDETKKLTKNLKDYLI